MNRILLILVILLIGTHVIFVSAQTEADVPTAIRYNRYYNQSLRLTNQARLAYEEGDYDASVRYSEEAIHYANLSDEYVAYRIRMWEADRAIYAAGRRLEYAASINANTRFPVEYGQARSAYDEARSHRAAENWDEAIEAANRVLAILAYLDGPTDGGQYAEQPGTGGYAEGTRPLPAQYTVRSWESVKDCLWNIAGRPWVYNDPWQWRRLFDANKAKMPETGNPDLIKPGMVLDIPSIRGEQRQGMWDANSGYSPLP